MAAPVNDNFASATLLSGNSGLVVGTNIEATTETGEPLLANTGKTVWFKYVPTLTQAVYFSTRYTPVSGAPVQPNGALENPLRTHMQAFTGTALNNLIEYPDYLPGATSRQNYGGWEYGSYLAINAVVGTTYYIRVGGTVDRATGARNEGNFALSYGVYYTTRLNQCNTCPPQFGRFGECVGVATVENIRAPATVSYGNQPKGFYVGAYCGGAIQFSNFTSSGWTVWSETVTEGQIVSKTYFTFIYKNSGNTAQLHLGNLPAAKVHKSQAEAEYAFRCAATMLQHSGGPIALDYLDSVYGDNINGNSNPTFSLYHITPKFSLFSVCGSWVTAGSRAQIAFRIQNDTGFPLSAISATLSGSGISNVTDIFGNSGPIVSTFPTNQTNLLEFHCDATTANLTATVTLTSSYFDPISFTVFVGPIITLALVTNNPQPSTCSGRVYDYKIQLIKSGFWRLGGVFHHVTLSGGLAVSPSPACANVSAIDVSINNIPLACGSGQRLDDIYFRPSQTVFGTIELKETTSIPLTDPPIINGTYSYKTQVFAAIVPS